jgi:hypothetical protein
MTLISSNDSINVNCMIRFLLNTYSNHGFSSLMISVIRTNATFVTPTISYKTIKELSGGLYPCGTLHVYLTET